MLITPITHEILSRSVVAVPPLARNADFSLNRAANKTLIEHLQAGGVKNIMYGGNANFYNLGVGDYAETIDMLSEFAANDTWILPSAGPEYGRLMDEATILKQRDFPTAMILPMTFPYTSDGLATGIRRFTDRLGKPAVIYIKADRYIRPETLASLVEEGRVAAIKYAAVHADPVKDAYLTELTQRIDKRLIVSGIGERPAIVHLRDFGLTSFTSGSVCVAPRGSMEILRLLKAQRYEEAEQIRARYMPLEDCRDEISPIRVLHDAVSLAGIADMGPMLPLLTGLSADERNRVQPVAKALFDADKALQETV
ncbi:dihydrodipicolinate synthase family protein [Sinorhizobium meliloti]|uniref:Dihydrodipicolinate synthase family protein n=1 Tax=Rhizobium meliloti TaxID=382 RepID=A0A2J0YYS7_RHIML|nr:dihydrodipicolinate synthase family protein [Sinorhizobium meliloti]PJR13435.1 dihydrodipicolinate synthase family protein [Sinorhizobium meliloti]